LIIEIADLGPRAWPRIVRAATPSHR
jgi:hypothetical protein